MNMFIAEHAMLVSSVGDSSRMLFRRNLRQTGKSQLKRRPILSMIQVPKEVGRVFIHDTSSGCHPS